MQTSGVEYGCRYELTSPSGAKAVFNDETSPYYVGVLDPEECSGLDSPEIRDSFSEVVEGEGAQPGMSYTGRRPIILGGIIRANGAQQRNERVELLKAASRSLRGDGTLQWSPQGGPEVFARIRLQQALRVTKGFVKAFQVPLVANDPRIYSTQLTTAIVTPAAGGESGLTFPIKFPLSFGTVAYAGQVLAVNEGTAESPPIIRVYGPGVNPTLANITTGESVLLSYNLGAGEYLELDFANSRVLLNGNTNRYSAYNYAASDWWTLAPGQNDIRLNFFSYSAGAKMELAFRSAWL